MPKTAKSEAYKPLEGKSQLNYNAIVRSEDGRQSWGPFPLTAQFAPHGQGITIREWLVLHVTEEEVMRNGEPTLLTIRHGNTDQFTMRVHDMQWRKQWNHQTMTCRYEYEVVAQWAGGPRTPPGQVSPEPSGKLTRDQMIRMYEEAQKHRGGLGGRF